MHLAFSQAFKGQPCTLLHTQPSPTCLAAGCATSARSEDLLGNQGKLVLRHRAAPLYEEWNVLPCLVPLKVNAGSLREEREEVLSRESELGWWW